MSDVGDARAVDLGGWVEYVPTVQSITPPTSEWKRPFDYVLAFEAVAYLALARLAVQLLPFDRIVGWMDRPLRAQTNAFNPHRVIRAVERASSRVPWRSVCIHHGIAAQRMLRRRGHDARFVYGLSSAKGPLLAHVWIELDGAIMIGQEAASDFCPVAVIPADPEAGHRLEVQVDCGLGTG